MTSLEIDRTNLRLKQKGRIRTIVNKSFEAIRNDDNAYKPRPRGYKTEY